MHRDCIHHHKSIRIFLLPQDSHLLCREQMCGYQGGGRRGRNWEIGIDVYALLILCKNKQLEPSLHFSIYSTGNSTQCSVVT